MIYRNKDGSIYNIELNNPIPPPSSEKYSNKLHGEVCELIDVVNYLLEELDKLKESK